MAEWISVYERLPNKGQVVVVMGNKGTWDYGMFKGLDYCVSGKQKPDYWRWKKNTRKTVKWWMDKNSALPEPPKEEGE